MAKNWTLKEAVKIITAGENKEAIQEIGKRFPLTTVAIAKIGHNEGVDALMSVMPDHVTMLKLERAFKEGVEDTDADDADNEDVEDTDETSDAGEQDLSEMTSKQLYALCVKKGIKAKKYGVNKQYYLDLLNGGGDEEDADEDTDDEDEGDNEEEAVDYESMKAPELYSLCKKRGIKIQPKQKASVYIKALKAADAETEEDTDAEDDNWDDEEEEASTKEPGNKKAGKGSEKKAAPAKKSAKKEADGEEDWDI